MVGLVWNSMMSFAGGWFIITVNEAFMGYELPGLGSYMVEAQNAWNVPAMIAGVLAMVSLIVLLDQILWRPIVVWSEKFKVEETTAAEQQHSWFLQLLRRSPLLEWAQLAWKRRHYDPRGSTVRTAPKVSPVLGRLLWKTCQALVVGACLALAVWGAFRLGRLLASVPFYETAVDKGWQTVLWALFLSFLRVTAAVVIGAAWTLPVGILIGLSPKWSNRLQPVVQVVASFPAPMIYLLMSAVMLKMHLAFTFGCVVLMLLGTQWYTLFNVIAGAMAIPSDLREAGRVYHVSRWQRWTRIYVPAVFPFLVTGLITAAGGAWNATIVAEQISLTGPGAQSYYAFGIGSLIDGATSASDFPLLAAAVVAMGLAVVVINRILWKRLYRVAEERFSLNM
jgi:NitT/TauT family transport system permease protein